jgi:hypothetical protein
MLGLRSTLLLGSVLCCMGALLTSTAFIMVINSKAVLVPFEDAADIVTALQQPPAGFTCNSIQSRYKYVTSWPKSAANGSTTPEPNLNEKTTCNTAANYLDFMCKHGQGGIANYLIMPQGFTIAAAVLLVAGLFVHVLIKEHWAVTLLYFLFVVVVGAWFGSLLTFYSSTIVDKQNACVFDEFYKL